MHGLSARVDRHGTGITITGETAESFDRAARSDGTKWLPPCGDHHRPRRYQLRLWHARPLTGRSTIIYDDRTQDKLRFYSTRGSGYLRGKAGALRADGASMGRGGCGRRHRADDRPVPVHADDSVAEVLTRIVRRTPLPQSTPVAVDCSCMRRAGVCFGPQDLVMRWAALHGPTPF